MSIYTLEALFDFMANELSWRRHELSHLRNLVTKDLKAGSTVLTRSAVTMLYAHWEGFVRASAQAYLEFVAMQRLQNSELASNFVALSARRYLNEAVQSKQVVTHIQLVDFFLLHMRDRSQIPYKDVVNTESNLSSRVFKNIVVMLGLDYSMFATKEKIIDEKLLKMRNIVAHGQYFPVAYEDMNFLFNSVFEMMELFRNQIDNHASMGMFRSSG